MVVAYHNHANISSVEAFGRTGAWEQAFFYSKNNWANVDVGHFTAGNGKPPIDFLREYHDRITNIHLKDRKINGPNMPWGQGDTPLRDILQLMKREQCSFTATIELGISHPRGFVGRQRGGQLREVLPGRAGVSEFAPTPEHPPSLTPLLTHCLRQA